MPTSARRDRISSSAFRPAAPPRPAIRIEAIDSAAGFVQLREEWTDLLCDSAANGAFLTWEWLHTWWRRLGGRRGLLLLAARAGDRLVGLAPWTVSRGTVWPPLPVVEFLGCGAVGSDYLDVIARHGHESAVAEALARHLQSQPPVVLRLHGVTAGESVAARLADALAARGWTRVVSDAGVCPFIHVDGDSLGAVLERLGAEHRYNVRRRLRNLTRAFDVSFDPADSEASRREALDVLVRLHNARWRARGGSTALDDPSIVAFHDEVTRAFLDRGWLRLFVLRVDGAPAAALYGFLYGGKFYFYQSGFDERHARHSVGMVALAMSLDRAAEEGAREYDLLHGDEAYKSRWTSHSRVLVRLELYPPRLRGRLQHAGTALRRAGGRWTRPARRALGLMRGDG